MNTRLVPFFAALRLGTGAALDALCPTGCEEYTELKEKIDAYRARTRG